MREGILRQIEYVMKLKKEISDAIMLTVKNSIIDLANLIVEFVGIFAVEHLVVTGNDYANTDQSFVCVCVFNRVVFAQYIMSHFGTQQTY